MTTTLPVSDANLWSDKNLADPFPLYRNLRDLGPVVYLSAHDIYAITRYDDVKRTLNRWQEFSNASGVGFNETINTSIAGSLIGSDPPLHRHYRMIMERPLTPAALKQVRNRINFLATEIVKAAGDKGQVEAVSELASCIPTKLVAELVGLPSEGRERMLDWASAAFNALAPEGVDRVAEGFKQFADMIGYFENPSLPERLTPGSWGAMLRDAAKNGEIEWEQFLNMLQNNYVLAALDSTIHAISNLLWLLAEHPDTWAMLRSNRMLVGRAVNESLRLEGPAQGFSRLTKVETNIGGSIVPANKRLFVSNASANRDERHYSDPDRFDITRDASDHLAFGFKEHLCLGRNLATLEMTSLLYALVDRVERITIVDCERELNNALRGFKRLNLELQLAF